MDNLNTMQIKINNSKKNWKMPKVVKMKLILNMIY